MTGPGDERAAAQGQGQGGFRASHADREQVVDVLKAAFVAGRLTKDELDMRVGQVLASRTYAELAAVTADLPAGVPEPRPARPPVSAEGPSRQYRRAVAWAACVVIPLVLLLSGGVGPPFILGFFAAMMTAGCLIAAAAEQKRSRKQLPQDPASGAGRQGSQRSAPGQLPPVDHGQEHTAEAAQRDRAQPRSPASRSAHQSRHRGHRYPIGYAGS